MKEKKQLTQEDMQNEISAHILKNDHLRNDILNNPKEIIERELNLKFNEEIKINIVNHTSLKEVTFYLPYNPLSSNNGELNDEQLEQVSGGMSVGTAALIFLAFR